MGREKLKEKEKYQRGDEKKRRKFGILKRKEGYQAHGKLFYLWLRGFMVILKVKENWNFNELVLHAALWWRYAHGWVMWGLSR